MFFLVGPTAVGKSAIALELAPLLNAEIIAADSMQIYRYLDIATAKPTTREQKQVPHHGLDLVEPTFSFSVADWLTYAQKAIQEIKTRGKTPLIVGGTGLYIRALRQGLFPSPATSNEMKATFGSLSLDQLVEKLLKFAPSATQTIDLKNRRRVERALAILQQGGTLQRNNWLQTHHSLAPIFGLTRAREDLNHRINHRVKSMLKAGLEKEYSLFVENRLPSEATAWQALGYRQIQAYREGKISYETCVDRIKKETRQYAKRQITWFKRETGIQWISLSPEESPAMTAQRIYEMVS